MSPSALLRSILPESIRSASLRKRAPAIVIGVRIGVGDPFLWRDCDPGIAVTAQEAVNALVRAGATGRS
jgi:hypothetical protein